MTRGNLLRGAGCLALAILVWGAMFPVAKRTLPILDAYFLGSIRYAIGTAIFVVLLWASEGRAALSYGGRLAPAVLFGTFGFTGFNVLVWLGLTYTRPEHAAIIMSLQTPLTALALWLTRGLQPARFTLLCIGCAIGGVFLVVTRGHPAAALAAQSESALLGDLLVFLGAVSWVVYTMAGGYFTGWSPLRMTVLTCIPGALGLVAVNAIMVWAGFSHWPGADAVLAAKWQIVYFSLFTVVIGVLCFNSGVRHLGALNTMLMLNLVPVMVFAIEAALGRSFGAVEIGGAAIVIGALAANNLYLRRRVIVRAAA
jgi:drug/metabolite transporter (DMT)-like permease